MNGKLLLFVLGSVPLIAQPSIRLVANNASYGAPGYLNSGIAQGSLFAVLGAGFAAPGTQVQATDFPLSTSMAGVSIRVTSGTTSTDALLLYVTERQVGAILPSKTPTGAATVTLKTAAGSASFSITVVSRSFGIFTLNQGGTGPALAQNFRSETDQPVNSLLAPAKPGQVVTLWGTGLGAVKGDESAGPQPGDLNPGLHLFVGNAEVPIMYAGRSGCCAGIDQVSFVVPAGIVGCYVPVVFYHSPLNFRIIQDVAPQSNFATISISPDGSTCTDPTGFSGKDIDEAQRSGSWRTGAIAVEQWVPFQTTAATTTLAGSFGKLTPAAFLRSQGIFGYPALGTCLTYPVASDTQSAPFPTFSPGLNAGSALTLTGPAGTLQAARKDDGSYSGSEKGMTLSPGTYTVSNGQGGSDVGGFSVPITVPAPLQWTNRQAFVNPLSGLRSSSIPFQWSGGDPNSFVILTSLGYTAAGGAYTICTQPVSAGSFSIEAITLLIVGVEGGFGPFPNVFGLSEVAPTVRFSAPGLDAGYVSVAVGDGVLVP